MKSRKFLLLLSASLAVLMVIVIILTTFLLGWFTPVSKKTTKRSVYYQKDGFVPGENTTSEVFIDETNGMFDQTGTQLADDSLNGSGNGNGGSDGQSSQPAYVLEELTLAKKYYTRQNVITQKMADASLLNEGNQVRLNNKFKAFMQGGQFTIGYIGGSITEGAAAASEADRYANQTTQWLDSTFPRSTFTTANAGIGSTGSYIGVHRVSNDLIAKNPDIVFIEYAVNDTKDDALAQQAYESLIRKLWNSKSKPAIILLINIARDKGTKEYYSAKDNHLAIGRFYDLPVLSPGDAIIYTCTNEKMAQWNELISEDDWIHPTSYGHSIISQVIQVYLRGVLEDSIAGKITGKESDFSADSLDDVYQNAAMLQPAKTTPAKVSGFKTDKSTVLYRFTGFWSADKVGSSIEFDVTAKNIGLLFLKVDPTDTQRKSGTFDVYVDGKKVNALDTLSSDEYPYGEEILAFSKSGKHHVKIVLTSGELYLQALLTA